ncbi:hypothetical protein [Rubidibacter lacunae]|uniref:hypothetical protein n=1 Tax=Rubidibacter lacunae TaxID=582514 RepID=UPI0004293C4C|nr:hypothetical protein [Rubidibacter lacunae]
MQIATVELMDGGTNRDRWLFLAKLKLSRQPLPNGMRLLEKYLETLLSVSHNKSKSPHFGGFVTSQAFLRTTMQEVFMNT